MIRAKVTVTGLSAMAANFHRLDEKAKEKVLAAQAETGEEHRRRMADEAPKDTGFMAAHTEVRFSDGGYRYEVGYWAEPFLDAGLPFYVPYPLFGTSRMQANPWMFRATEPMREIARRRVGDALNDAVNEVGE
jgi:hypothetical protein